MTTAATSLLGLALPVTGELSGTWGDTVNNSITSLLDSAIAGTTTLSTDGDVTLTTTTLASNQARQAILLFSGARTAQRTVTAPAQSKIYTVINATTGGYAVKLVGAGPTTGLTIPNGASAIVAWNGSDFIEIGTSSIGNLTVNGNLTVTGTSTLTGGATIQGLTVGKGAGAVSTNTAVGVSALAANTTGSTNTAVGNLSLSGNTTGARNTAIGHDALLSNTTASDNTAAGWYALGANTTGASNTAMGKEALGSNTTASNNTAVGYQAGYSATTGPQNVYLGFKAGYSNQTEGNHVFVGYLTGYSTTAGTNCAVGSQVFYSNTTGDANTAVGSYRALYYNTTGSYNVAIGHQALQANTTASNNTAVGYQAGYSSTAAYGTFFGHYAGLGVTTGGSNTFIGADSGYLVTTGSKNTILGSYSGNQGGLDIRTASNYIVLSDGDGNPRGIFDASGNFMVGATTPSNVSAFTFNAGANRGGIFQNSNTGAHVLEILNTSSSYNDANGGMLFVSGSGTTETGYRAISVYSATGAKFAVRGDGTIYSSNTSVQSISDERFKENVRPLETGVAHVMQLQPRRFDWKQGKGTGEKDVAGFIAQEIETVFPELVSEFKDGFDDATMYKSVGYSGLIPTLVRAIQELKTENDQLKARLDAANL